MNYPFPKRLFLDLSLDLIRHRSRSSVDDAEKMWNLVPVAPTLSGVDNIPMAGPLIVAANHYQRRGLWIAWPASLIGRAIAQRRQGEPVSWLVVSQLRLAQWKNAGPVIPGTRVVLTRVARSYGFIPLPLASPSARAAGVQQAMNVLRRGGVVGVFPEGTAGRSDELRSPKGGAERLMELLSAHTPVLPAAITEDDGRLRVEFAPPLVAVSNGSVVMKAIADLLPARQRGPYR